MIEQLAPAELAALLERHPGTQVVDVRAHFEREMADIPGSIHIPMPTIPARMEELSKDEPVVLFCHTGVRSMNVAGFLAQHGFEKLYNLAGGIDRYACDVAPDMPRY